MFEHIASAPPDPILGLNEAFQKDARADKINLGVGVYLDAQGKVPVFAAVRAAERRLVETGAPKTYLPISGTPRFGALVQDVIFTPSSSVVTDGRGSTLLTPGGTGALRVAGDFIATHAKNASGARARMWISNPTWENHAKIFAAAGLETKTYRYLDAAKHALDAAGLLEDLSRAERGDVVLLHGSCHNPTGVDPSKGDWKTIANLLVDKGLVPLVDLAYQGLGDGLDDDAFGVRHLASVLPELLVASSYSKSFGLYGERTGALTAVSADRESAARVMSQLKVTVRTNYSNPPRHGGVLVETILDDAALRAEWSSELDVMRARIHAMRRGLVDGLKAAGVARDFSFLAAQRGMFSYSGLTAEQVDRLREEHGVYAVRSGRINVAGLTPANLPLVCERIARVLA